MQSAEAQFFTSSGANNSFPINLFPINPASPVLDFTGNNVQIGNTTPGSFSALNGALLKADSLGVGIAGTGIGSVTITGPGTQVQLTGLATRADLGSWGTSTVTVSAGALLDASLNTAGCATAGNFCGAIVGNGAGSTSTLNVTGAGSEVRTVRGFVVGQAAVFTQAHDGFNFGTPGGTTNAVVNITAGGTLRTQLATIGSGPTTAAALGTEHGIGTVVVDGIGSRWIVTPDSVSGVSANNVAGMTLGQGVGGQGSVTIRNGGKLLVDGTTGIGPNDFINIGVNGGHADLTVTGVGSSIDVVGHTPIINVGRSGAGGQGSFSVLAGATASSIFTDVGRDSATGTLLVSGAGSTLSMLGAGAPGQNDAGMLIGGTGGTGQATVSNGGQILIGNGGADNRATNNDPGMTIGRETGSSGSLTITGVGSLVQITTTSLSPAPGVIDNFNPGMTLGRDAGSSGTLTVTNGGKLVLQGGAISTAANSRATTVNIGGASDTAAGGIGTALVSGAGSELRVSGSDAFIGVGRGSGSIGQLTVSSGGLVSATNVGIGRGVGATGVLTVDAASLALSGQQTGNTLSGAALSIGQGGGTGTATITNGSRVDITNPGSAGASLNVGGSGTLPLGNGTLTVSGASQINVNAASGLATFTIGRDGTGVATVSQSSVINVGDGSAYVGRLAGSNGTLVLQSGSSLNAGYVGVGRTPAGDGGTGRLIVDNSTVTATTVEIGTGGYLGGNNGTINGNVTLHGTLSPGDSPGRIIINGGIQTGSGHLILEVASNGDGGFLTDQLILTRGSTFSFTGLEVTFSFLGNLDPNAFANSGRFDLDTFLETMNTDGSLEGLSSAFAPGQTYQSLFALATFDAEANGVPISNAQIGADGSVVFTAAAVPEPQTWALLLLGLTSVLALDRRRRRGVKTR